MSPIAMVAIDLLVGQACPRLDEDVDDLALLDPGGGAPRIAGRRRMQRFGAAPVAIAIAGRDGFEQGPEPQIYDSRTTHASRIAGTRRISSKAASSAARPAGASSTLTMPMAPSAPRPSAKLAMLTRWRPRIGPTSPMTPG